VIGVAILPLIRSPSCDDLYKRQAVCWLIATMPRRKQHNLGQTWTRATLINMTSPYASASIQGKGRRPRWIDLDHPGI